METSTGLKSHKVGGRPTKVRSRSDFGVQIFAVGPDQSIKKQGKLRSFILTISGSKIAQLFTPAALSACSVRSSGDSNAQLKEFGI